MRRLSTLNLQRASKKDRPSPTTNFGFTMNCRARQFPIESVKTVLKAPQLPAWKRAIDLACCLIALPFLGVFSALMALGLRLTSPGPILFKQERVGYKGSRFMCYKFRTMAVGSDTKSHQAYYENLVGSNAPMVKLDSSGDKRLLPGGWLVRASGLDELPQIINILRGEMSIVGPRPCIQYEYDRYEPWHRERFNAVPGLTGLWQVSGKNRTTFDEMVRLDIRYSESISLWLDLKIITMTVPALVVQVSDMLRARKSRGGPAGTRPGISSTGAISKRNPQAAGS
ncbi:MAG: sugar transferase [Opitutaceae bacterium]|jgi:lipopolysaccharide/colanic/teichoic acid biosynthesis glycosyltransferase